MRALCCWWARFRRRLVRYANPPGRIITTFYTAWGATVVTQRKRLMAPPGVAKQVVQAALALALLKQRAAARAKEEAPKDCAEWLEANFVIPSTSKVIELRLHQKGILRIALTRDAAGRLPFTTCIYSTVKKSGKSTIAGGVAKWFAETQTNHGEIYAIGNDGGQARERSYKEVRTSIELTPGYEGGRQRLPGRWQVFTNTLRYLPNHSRIMAISIDARGEAGGHPNLSIWTELWGFEYEDALRFWDEMTPIPTQQDSIRWVETYAGYDGESLLLYSLYVKTVKEGRQLTNAEWARRAARDVAGERYEDMLHAFAETGGDPEALVPIYVNEAAAMFAYWDEGPAARRMPWLMGPDGERYYREQEGSLPPAAYRRLHFNEWVGAESSFVPIEVWDSCYDPSLPLLRPNSAPGLQDGEPCVIGVDAAATGDSFAVVAVTRHPDKEGRGKIPAIRRVKVWTPDDFPDKRIDFSVAEEWLRIICKAYNVKQIAYDPYQLEDMMQRLSRERVAWCEEFLQGKDRLEADRAIYDRIMQHNLAHCENPEHPSILRTHVLNANAKVQKDEDSKLRIIKKAENRKIDALVAASMACSRIMYLNI